jgi:hypothetical protein
MKFIKPAALISVKLLPKSRNNKMQITYSVKQTISKIYPAELWAT